MNEQLQARGALSVVLTGPDGQVKQTFDVKNLVVDVGLAFIASRMKDATATAMTHMGVGSGTAGAVAANTSLANQLGSRVALASTNVTGAAIAYQATFGPGVGTGAVTEAGLFNASVAGTMLCRTVFPVVNKGADDTISIAWTITLGAT
jgi:hypothetical protein